MTAHSKLPILFCQFPFEKYIDFPFIECPYVHIKCYGVYTHVYFKKLYWAFFDEVGFPPIDMTKTWKIKPENVETIEDMLYVIDNIKCSE